MSINNFFQDPEQQEPVLGMDTTSPVQALKPGYVRSAKNAYPGLEGGYVKRGGYATVLSSAWSTRTINGGIEYKNSSGTRLPIIFGTDGTAAGGILASIVASAPVNIATALSGTARPYFIQFDSLLYFFNGADAPLVYDGVATRQMGITAPAAAPTVVLSAGGSLNTNANYIWAYTYYNSVSGAESTPSVLSATTATAANTKATLTLLAGSVTTADTIRIYRTFANGQQLYLDGTAAISATSYVSTIADAALASTVMELDNTRVTTWSGTPNYPLVADRRLWLRTNKNELRYSKFGQSGPMQESFPVSNVVDVTGAYGFGDDVVGLGKAGEVPIVLKERSVGRLEVAGMVDPSVAADSTIYFYRELSAEVGALSHGAIGEVYGECVFLTKDNVYGTRGRSGDLRPLADPIQATIKALGFTTSQITKVSTVNDVKQRQLRFQVYLNSNATTPAYTLVGDYRAYPHFRWTWDTPGPDTSIWPGITAASYFTVTNAADGTQDVYFGGMNDGQVYKLNSGTTDNGKSIYFEIVDRPRGGTTPLAVKLWKKGTFWAGGDGSNYNLTITAIYDLSGEEEGSQAISLATGSSLWDSSTWDVSTFAANSVPSRLYSTQRKARFQQLVFRQTGASQPLTLYTWYAAGSKFQVF